MPEAEIYQRMLALEIAYNPNDCVERRWGEAPGTPEYGMCRRRSPAEQQERMEEYRLWFREGRWPPRQGNERDLPLPQNRPERRGMTSRPFRL